ncbi:hypothetical protein LJC55_01260 [Eubacteriales bacterium OttesenSCG-928-N14]|nr:hypothetical protein [Eubacteriales bacterium OttesenSCG-928-N14]
MDIINTIVNNPYLTVLLLGVILILSTQALKTREIFYTQTDDERMQYSALNKKYQLNRREGVNVKRINATIANYQSIAILLSCGVMMLNMLAGAITLLAALAVATNLANKKMGEYYGNNPIRPVRTGLEEDLLDEDEAEENQEFATPADEHI